MAGPTRIRLYSLLLAAGLAWIGWPELLAASARHHLAEDPDQAYALYVPDRCGETPTCPVVVFVHGTGGDGDRFLPLWRGAADEEGWIALCPTFHEGYTTLAGGEDQRLVAILDEVGREHPYDGVYLAGFSGGAQFAHRFVFGHPFAARAVALHSAGVYDAPPRERIWAPFLVTVGARDERRVEPARELTARLQAVGIEARFVMYPDIGHSFEHEQLQDTRTFFREEQSRRAAR